jgi:hypothetical protein
MATLRPKWPVVRPHAFVAQLDPLQTNTTLGGQFPDKSIPGIPVAYASGHPRVLGKLSKESNRRRKRHSFEYSGIKPSRSAAWLYPGSNIREKMEQDKGSLYLQQFEENLARDYIEEAVKCLRKSVKERNLRAMYWLGKLYDNGWLGCQYSEKRASDIWLASIEYGPSRVCYKTKNGRFGDLSQYVDVFDRPDDYLVRAMCAHRYDDIVKCKGVYLEYYYMAARYLDAISFESRVQLLNDGANLGCTDCLEVLHERKLATPWQLRRLWRHNRRISIPDLLDKRPHWTFECLENIRHIICLLEWARQTKHSLQLSVLPRDVLCIILKMLMRTYNEEDHDGRRVWNNLPKKRRRIK